MNQTIKMFFDAVAGDYDRQRKQLIPCFDEFYGMALSLIESENPSPTILDLGAGTGLLSSLVLQKYPNAQLTLMDLSDKMLDGARQRFQQEANVQYIVADYSNFKFTETYDCVISSLSIHHLTHPAKKELFTTIYQILGKNGVFVNADQVQGNTPSFDTYYRKRWLEYINQSGLSQEVIDSTIERRSLDINAKLEAQINWMEQAGFVEVDCMFKYLDFAVFFARKA